MRGESFLLLLHGVAKLTASLTHHTILFAQERETMGAEYLHVPPPPKPTSQVGAVMQPYEGEDVDEGGALPSPPPNGAGEGYGVSFPPLC